jgi:hypothetical protein
VLAAVGLIYYVRRLAQHSLDEAVEAEGKAEKLKS